MTHRRVPRRAMRPGAALPTSAQAHAALEFVNRTELGAEHDGDLKCEMAALRALLEQARTPHRVAAQIDSAIRCPCARVGGACSRRVSMLVFRWIPTAPVHELGACRGLPTRAVLPATRGQRGARAPARGARHAGRARARRAAAATQGLTAHGELVGAACMRPRMRELCRMREAREARASRRRWPSLGSQTDSAFGTNRVLEMPQTVQ